MVCTTQMLMTIELLNKGGAAVAELPLTPLLTALVKADMLTAEDVYMPPLARPSAAWLKLTIDGRKLITPVAVALAVEA